MLMAIKRYKIKDSLKVKEAISIENLKELGAGGFIILKIDTLDEDALMDIKEEITFLDIDVPVILIDKDMDIAEAVDKIEQDIESGD